MLEQSGYLEALKAERTIEAQGRIENLLELGGVALEYQAAADNPTLSEFLQQISLFSDQDALAEEGSRVTLMTLHNAKGLEFRAVFLVGMEEGVFPHARSIEEQGIEEERRLAYVGLTRAQERLTLTHAATRSLWGSRDYRSPSRFLEELPEDEIQRERLRPGVVDRLQRAARVPGAHRARARPLDRGLRAPLDARRGRRRPHRGRRHRHRPLRPGRRRAPAHARLRAAGEGPLSVEIRTAQPEELRDGLRPIWHYFGSPAGPDEGRRGAMPIADGRLHVAVDGGAIVAGAGVFEFEMTIPGGPVPDGGGDGGRRPPDAPPPRHRARAHGRPAEGRARRGEPIAALWASEGGIYGRFGYGLASVCADVEIPRDARGFARPVEWAGSARLVTAEEARALPAGLRARRTGDDRACSRARGVVEGREARRLGVAPGWWRASSRSPSSSGTAAPRRTRSTG